MTIALTLLMFFLANAGIATATNLTKETLQKFEKCDAYNIGTGDCAKNIERSVLSKNNNTVSRHKNILKIHTAARLIEFEGKPDKGDQSYWYSYLGYFKEIGYYLIHIQYWEGDEAILVSNATGQQVTLSAIPQVSPSKNRIISVEGSEAYNKNGVTVWRVSHGNLVEEFRYEPQGYVLYKFLKWIGDSKILLEKSTRSKGKFCPKGSQVTLQEQLELHGEKWALIADSDPKSVKCHKDYDIEEH